MHSSFKRPTVPSPPAFRAARLVGVRRFHRLGQQPPPATNLQAAQQAIANAERVDAATLAAVELGEARAKLSAAEQAVDEKEMIAGRAVRR